MKYQEMVKNHSFDDTRMPLLRLQRIKTQRSHQNVNDKTPPYLGLLSLGSAEVERYQPRAVQESHVLGGEKSWGGSNRDDDQIWNFGQSLGANLLNVRP